MGAGGSQRVRGGDTRVGHLLNRAIKQLSIRMGRVRAGDCALDKVTYRGEHIDRLILKRYIFGSRGS